MWRFCASHAGLTLGKMVPPTRYWKISAWWKCFRGWRLLFQLIITRQKLPPWPLPVAKARFTSALADPFGPFLPKKKILWSESTTPQRRERHFYFCLRTPGMDCHWGRGKDPRRKGISVEVINIHTSNRWMKKLCWLLLKKPAVLLRLKNTIFTVDWATVLPRLQQNCRKWPVPIEYVGTNDTFGESGKPAELLVKYGLDTAHIVAAAEKAIARKSNMPIKL